MEIMTEIVRMKMVEGVAKEDFVKWINELDIELGSIAMRRWYSER